MGQEEIPGRLSSLACLLSGKSPSALKHRRSSRAKCRAGKSKKHMLLHHCQQPTDLLFYFLSDVVAKI